MSSINAINSQVNFTGARRNPKAAQKKADRPKLNELGGRTFEEKYSKDGKPVNMTTANAGILLGDYILDHIIEFTVAGVAFIGVGLKGKKMMNGVSGSLFDAAKQLTNKDGDKLNAAKKITTYLKTAKVNIQNLKNSQANKIIDSAKELHNENAAKKVMEGSLIDKFAKKVDDEGSFISKFVKKISRNPDINSEDVNKFFSNKLGITRGADIADNAVALGAAGIASKVAKDGTDIGTDLNDQDVANRADAANHRSLQKAQKVADVVFKAL